VSKIIMEIYQIIDQIQAQASKADPIGGSIKFILDDQILLIDGTGNSNKVSQENGDADCTISTSVETLMKMKSGELNPMMAAMSGKVKISGDMSLAMKLQSLI
jgi:putative sterol carrier protein